MANPQAVQTMVIGTYLDLMGKLIDLPADIAEAQAILMEVKSQLGKSELTLKDIETKTALMIEGPNADVRKAKLAEALRLNATYIRWDKAADTERAEVAKLTQRLADLERQYGAVGYQVRLHAGLMNYLGNAGANVAVPEMTFAMGALALSLNGNGHHEGQGHVTPADAADIGL